MTIPKIFKSEQFALREDYHKNKYEIDSQSAAETAQSILEKWLKENGKIVGGYAFETNKEHTKWLYRENNVHLKPDTITHEAILICIEEIKKECVEHEPDWINKIPGWHHGPDSEVECRKCKVKLRAKWEEA